MLSAQELYERGIEHANAGRHSLAAGSLARAAQRTDDPDLSARIVGTRAYLVAETGDPEQALEQCRVALDHPGLSEHTRAVLISQVGLIELRRGNVEPALAHLNAVTADLADDPARLGRVLLNRGLAHLDRGHVGGAERDFAWAAQSFQRSGEVVEQAKAQHNEGYAALIRGDLVQALQLMEQAREVLVGLSPVTLAVCDLDRAAVLRSAGETREAVQLLLQAARIFRARRLRQAQGEAELLVGETLLGTDPVAASAAARRAARLFRARGNTLGALRAQACAVTALVLATAAAGSAHDGRATVLLSRITTTADALADRGLHWLAWPLLLQRARLEIRIGEHEQASAHLRAARPAGRVPIQTRVLSREVRAELALAQGRPLQVLAHAAAGLDELEAWLSEFGSVDLQGSAAAHGRTLVLHGVRAALTVGDPAAVFEWSERARSLAGRVTAVRPPADPQNAADLAELRRLRLMASSPLAADGSRETQLRAAIRRRTWARRGPRVRGTIAPLDQVRAELLSTGADLLAYLWSGDRLAVLVVSDSVQVVDLGEWKTVQVLLDGLLPDMDMASAELPAEMAAVVGAALADRLAALGELLVAPVRELLGGERVVITQPGVLSGVPWDILAGLAGSCLTRPTSASVWLGLRSSPITLSRAGLVAGPGVARAADEVSSAADAWPTSQVLLAAQATTEAVAGLAQSVDVLHVAAHGRHSSENPLFSGFDLIDGPWFGYDIDRLDRVPAVVVLSACELGRSATEWGREALGMAQAWLHAGSRCVIAAGSSINDRVATQVLSDLHQELAAGRSPSDALRRATAAAGTVTSFTVHGAGW